MELEQRVLTFKAKKIRLGFGQNRVSFFLSAVSDKKRVRETHRKFSKKLIFYFFILSIFLFLILGFENWHWTAMSNHHRSSSKNGLPPQELLDDLCRFRIFFFRFLFSCFSVWFPRKCRKIGH